MTERDGPLAAYRQRRTREGLRPDPAQERCAERLQRLHDELKGYRPRPPRRRRDELRRRLGLGRGAEPSAPPRGLYIHGPVGRGKSMLMDLFFEGAPVAAKRRVHFHAFMLDVHARLHRRRQQEEPPSTDDALKDVAADLAEEAWLLCFDEFHVDNIVDAMLLGRLFAALFERGVVVVATSNWPPERLYEGGLQRDLFVPFIDLLKERLEVVALKGPTDYRLERLREMPVYHTPLGPATDEALDDAFAALTDGAEAGPEEVALGRRRLRIPKAADGVARFTFAELCERPLGAADYLALAERYHTLIVAGVPVLRPNQRNEAKRLIALIDTLYDKGVRLIVGAEAEPAALYPEGDHAFEFQRAVSRLMEMQSREYVEGR